mmetsp:Transcript_2292/g.5081  ORF Transcript_2292/g.5081 Transcript_2292/m.5081 type:complete len:675 (-) Transcript_2292:594-2618(-)
MPETYHGKKRRGIANRVTMGTNNSRVPSGGGYWPGVGEDSNDNGNDNVIGENTHLEDSGCLSFSDSEEETTNDEGESRDKLDFKSHKKNNINNNNNNGGVAAVAIAAVDNNNNNNNGAGERTKQKQNSRMLAEIAAHNKVSPVAMPSSGRASRYSRNGTREDPRPQKRQRKPSSPVPGEPRVARKKTPTRNQGLAKAPTRDATERGPEPTGAGGERDDRAEAPPARQQPKTKQPPRKSVWQAPPRRLPPRAMPMGTDPWPSPGAGPGADGEREGTPRRDDPPPHPPTQQNQPQREAEPPRSSLPQRSPRKRRPKRMLAALAAHNNSAVAERSSRRAGSRTAETNAPTRNTKTPKPREREEEKAHRQPPRQQNIQSLPPKQSSPSAPPHDTSPPRKRRKRMVAELRAHNRVAIAGGSPGRGTTSNRTTWRSEQAPPKTERPPPEAKTPKAKTPQTTTPKTKSPKTKTKTPKTDTKTPKAKTPQTTTPKAKTPKTKTPKTDTKTPKPQKARRRSRMLLEISDHNMAGLTDHGSRRVSRNSSKDVPPKKGNRKNNDDDEGSKQIHRKKTPTKPTKKASAPKTTIRRGRKRMLAELSDHLAAATVTGRSREATGSNTVNVRRRSGGGAAAHANANAKAKRQRIVSPMKKSPKEHHGSHPRKERAPADEILEESDLNFL